MSTNQFNIELNSTQPVIFTSSASNLDGTAYVLLLLVDEWSVGQIGKGIIIDPSNLIDRSILPTIIVEAISCANGYYQQELFHDSQLFTCTECEYNTFSMTNTKCKPCKGKNETYILSGYYGQIN